jgi:glycolate oxidase FAD binding subunit
VLGRTPQYISAPQTADELAAVMSWANTHRIATAARGGGSKMDWGNPPRALDLVVSTAALNQVVEHAFEDMTATVDSGCTVANFQRTLALHGQRLALDPLFPESATIGGVLATNDSGGLRLRFGSMRDLIIGITVALPDGTLARSGGKVVKNVAGYDLPKLFTGSLGTLGVITQATFRLHPLPQAAETFTAEFTGPQDANRFILRLLDSTLTPAMVQLRTGRQRETHVDVRYESTPAGIEAQMRRTWSLAGRREISSDDPWRAREELWSNVAPASWPAGAGASTPAQGSTTHLAIVRPETGPLTQADATVACICKCSVLPSEIGATCELLDQLAESALDWQAVVQATGTGWLRLEGNADQLAAAVERLRTHLESCGGSLALLHAPAEIGHRVETWGSAGSALPLMRRVKEQFDPGHILNPGRFVGDI